jgi:hypothetical protein
MPSGVFAIEQELIPLRDYSVEFARKLLLYDSLSVSAIEIKLTPMQTL